MFANALAFNQFIGGWNTLRVTDMTGMFGGARVYNRPMGGWRTENVRGMGSMFNGATSFNNGNTPNAAINGTWNGFMLNWDVRNVELMWLMFENTSFNVNISNWVLTRVAAFGSFRGGTCPLRDDFTPAVIRNAPGGGR
jgi:hypothetical protein